MAELKPAYLVSGDDDAKIDSWRSRLRRRAEEEHGPGGLELFHAGQASPDEVAAAVSTLTFATGTRYLLVEDAGAWKAGDLGPLEEALGAMPPEMVLLIVVRGKPLKQLQKAVEKAGGELRDCPAPKAWELPKWAAERARELGVQIDGDAAKALVGLAGPSQQRISRELEKIAVAVHPAARIAIEQVEELAAGEAPAQVYDLADSLVAGDMRSTLALAEDLAERDERPGRLIFPIVRRLREVHRAVELLESGIPERDVAGKLKAPPWLAKKTVAKAKTADRAMLERALCVFADLEIQIRGGGHLDEDTAFSLALAKAAA